MAAALGLPDDELHVISIDDFRGLNAKRPKNMIMNSQQFENEFGLKLRTTTQEIQRSRSDYI